MPSIDIGVSSTTLPSGAAVLTNCTAIWPPAPVLFSTTALFAYPGCSLSATRRETMSAVPPGAKPATTLTLSMTCAQAGPPMLASSVAALAD